MIRLLVLACLLVPFASASGRVDLGVVVVALDNGHEGSCVEDVSKLCLATASGEDVGDRSIDAYQRVRSVGVALNGTMVNDALGHALLPGGELTIRAEDTKIRHPVFRVIVENGLGNVSAPGPLQDFGLVITPDHYAIGYYGPNGETALTEQERSWIKVNFDDDALIGYEHVGPLNVTPPDPTDAHMQDVFWNPCYVWEARHCEIVSNYAYTTYTAQTPNVWGGLTWEHATFATDPALLSEQVGVFERDPPMSASGRRAPVPAPGAGRAPAPEPAPAREFALSHPGSLLDEPRTTPARDPVPVRAPSKAPREPEELPEFALLPIAAGLLIAFTLAAMYARIRTREHALRSDRRVQILAHLGEHGPSTLAELARSFGVDRSTIQHHARLLARTGEATLARHERNVYLVLRGQEPTPRPRGATATRIVDVLSQAGGALTRERLVEALREVPARTRNQAIQQLVAQGLLRRTKPVEVLELAERSGAS